MSTLLKHVGNLIAVAYGVVCMPVALILLVFMPFMTIADGFKIIETGYTVKGEYVSVMIAVLVLVYFSLRFKNLRKIYKVFPFLFETVKYLIFTNLFIAVGTEVLNWSHVAVNPGRHKLGIAVFVVSLAAWRIFVSVYYSKKPLANFMPKGEEIMQDYSENA